MTLPQQTLQRLPAIKAGLMKGDTIATIGKTLGVYEKTIDRDIKAFVESGEFETWIKTEWLRLHNQIIHEDPTEAYRNISHIIARMVTQKAEVKTEETLTQIKVLIVDNSRNPVQNAPETTGNLP